MDVFPPDAPLWQKLGLVSLGAVLLATQVHDLYHAWQDLKTLPSVSKSLLVSGVSGLGSLYSSITKVFHDYSTGHYYKPWKDRNVIVITDMVHLRELSDASQLSQRAVYADIFGFQYTMSHERTNLDPNEQTPHRYKLFNSVIRSIGGAQLSVLRPYLQAHVDQVCYSSIDAVPVGSEGWHLVQLAPLMRNLATGMLGIYFFGETMYTEPEFLAATDNFYHDVIRCMAGLPLVPSFARNWSYQRLTNNGQALRSLFRRLTEAIDHPERWKEDDNLKRLTLLYQLQEQGGKSDYWTTNLLIQAVVGIWFAASHQPWINLHFILLELCERPEYLDALRGEIDSQPDIDVSDIAQMKLLDSFIKECVRLNPLDRMAIRRKALQPFRFSKNGPFVPAGSIACVSAWDIMHDPSRYPHPERFDGYRFVGTRAGHSTRGTSFTDASQEFPVWGFGARVCPGRWHADLVLKLALVHLLRTYDFRLERPGDRHRWWWETFQLPYESTCVLFRPRAASLKPSTVVEADTDPQ